LPHVIRAEVRYCKACSRPLIGTEAERRRLLDESGPDGRRRPCGPSCERDRLSGVWRKLVFTKRSEAA
jgi:RNase P subunit RPR2